jgi:CDP-diacylglycerol---glycerol-3-phosphate 3-phosphatidyltransferase
MKKIATPHYFTFFRILLAPLFPLFYFKHAFFGISSEMMPIVLLAILFFGECSDLFDGLIARKRNQVTDLGKIMDPLADTIMRLTVFFTFTSGIVKLPLLLAFIFLYREFFMYALRLVCALKGFALAARKSGKIKAVIQASTAFAILFLMVGQGFGFLSIDSLRQASSIIAGVAATYSLLSLIDYLYANRVYLKKSLGS